MRRTLLSVLAAGALAVLPAPALAAPALVTPAPAAAAGRTSAGADDGARVVRETVVDARTVDLTISSPAVGTAKVRLLLPARFASSPDLRWPALYLLDGVDKQDYASWTHYTDVESFTAGSDVLVVMPTSGPSASYVDEFTLFGPPARWETFHTVELPQILQRGYRANGSNAVAGLSVGGFGALSYTFRHPRLYRATASYSGLTNLYNPAAVLAVLANRLNAGIDLDPWLALLANGLTSNQHNPLTNARKFDGLPLYLSCGDGTAGPLDGGQSSADQAVARSVEAILYEMNRNFASALKASGEEPTTHFYAGGEHSWPYWQRELHRSYPMLAEAVGGPTTGMAG